jgi:DNA-directed RNA polymerase sigma subunit (sigma70/sigma32)
MTSMVWVHRERRTPELDLFRLYLDEVGRHPLLTNDDEIELSQAYDAGLQAQLKLADTTADDPARPDLEAVAERGEWARRKMIESNLRLVVSIARRFSATGLPLGDLVQEGNLGLLRAVEKFDWRKGFKSASKAVSPASALTCASTPPPWPSPSASASRKARPSWCGA